MPGVSGLDNQRSFGHVEGSRPSSPSVALVLSTYRRDTSALCIRQCKTSILGIRAVELRLPSPSSQVCAPGDPRLSASDVGNST